MRCQLLRGAVEPVRGLTGRGQNNLVLHSPDRVVAHGLQHLHLRSDILLHVPKKDLRVRVAAARTVLRLVPVLLIPLGLGILNDLVIGVYDLAGERGMPRHREGIAGQIAAVLPAVAFLLVEHGHLAVVDGTHDIAAALPVPHQLIVARQRTGLLLLLLDDGADGMVKLGLRDSPGLLAAGHAEVRGGVRGQGNLHLDVDFRHILLRLLHAAQGAADDLVEVRA